MATIARGTRASSSKANVLRFALTGALTSGMLLILCWLGALLRIGPATHGYIQIFSTAEISSRLALFEGLRWSLLFGLVAGALIALAYNALRFLDER